MIAARILDMTPDRATTSRDILAFYQEAGVDIAVGETPVDRFAAEAPPPERGRPDGEAVRAGIRAAEAQDPHPTATRSPPPFQGEGGAPAAPQPPRTVFARDLDARGRMTTPAAPDTAVMAAREAARRADSLDTLRAILNDFTGCALRATATQLVFADGNPQARVMFVGEAPGRDEDIEGLPFVGRSGKLLDQMLAAIGLDRSSVYIANIVPWRPPGNRTPTPQETSICLPFTQRQIELVDPDVLVCLGNPSMQTLLATKEGITKSRGRWFPFHTGKRDIRAMPSYHPAFLLRSPLQKRLAWRDFLAIKKELAKPTGR
jgi:DNA polymerase